MKRSLLYLFWVLMALKPIVSLSQTTPSFSIIGTKEKSEGNGFVTIHCVYVEASNYDVTNAQHFEFIRAFVRSKGYSYADDFVDIYFFDLPQDLNICECGGHS